MHARDFKGLISMMKEDSTYTFKRSDWEDSRIRYEITRDTETRYSLRVWEFTHVLISIQFNRVDILDKELYNNHVFFYYDHNYVGTINLKHVGLKMMRVA